MNDRVTIDIDGGVADVQLARPDKLNALDAAMFAAIAEAGESLKAQPSVRAVVLSGQGRAFCAGIDVSLFSGGSGGDVPLPSLTDTGSRVANGFQQVAYVWSELPVPVIAAVHGVCYGGGIQIALGADIRLVAPDAKLSVMEIRWGMFPDMTGTARLPGLVGVDVAMDLTMTGRVVSGEEAGRLGLATRVVDDPRADALALAHELAGKNPHAIRAAKRLLQLSGTRPVADQLADEGQTMATIAGSANQIEAVMANLEKREPKFADSQ